MLLQKRLFRRHFFLFLRTLLLQNNTTMPPDDLHLHVETSERDTKLHKKVSYSQIQQEFRNSATYDNLHTFYHPSIHPSSGIGSQWQQAEQDIPHIALPRNTLQLLLGFPRHYQARQGLLNLQQFLGLPQSLFLAWKISKGRRPRSILTWYPKHLIWLLSSLRSNCSTRSSHRMTELLTLARRLRPATFLKKLILAAFIHGLILSVTIQNSWTQVKNGSRLTGTFTALPMTQLLI